jgi:hypothetical protein
MVALWCPLSHLSVCYCDPELILQVAPTTWRVLCVSETHTSLLAADANAPVMSLYVVIALSVCVQ